MGYEVGWERASGLSAIFAGKNADQCERKKIAQTGGKFY